jgi:hypothetical protein
MSQGSALTNGRGGPAVRGGGGSEEEAHFDELHIQLGVLLHVLQQVSMECLHLCGARGGSDQGGPAVPSPASLCTFYYNALPTVLLTHQAPACLSQKCRK